MTSIDSAETEVRVQIEQNSVQSLQLLVLPRCTERPQTHPSLPLGAAKSGYKE